MNVKESVQLLGIAIAGVITGWLITRERPVPRKQKKSELSKIPGEVRMALVVRSDIPMLKGKAAAQCAHAAVGAYMNMADPRNESYDPDLLHRWQQGGQAKIALKGRDLESMEELMAMALSLGVNCELIVDAGRTQLAPNTATVLGIGPAPRPVLDQITGELQLL